MRVLYIAPYKDASGYGEAARNYIRALSLHKVDLTTIPVKYDAFNEDASEFDPFVKRPEGHYDLIIEHLNPGEFGKYLETEVTYTKRVGITTHETDGIPQRWVERCNQMDAILIPCEENQLAFRRSGVTSTIYICHHCFDVTKYEKKYPEAKLEGVNGNKTIFYSIFQHSYKKGLDLLIPAFYMAFNAYAEDVVLVLRTHTNTPMDPVEVEYFKKYVHKIREQFHMSKFPDICILSGNLSTESLYALHQACDIYVSASRGEGWGIPMFDALAFGNTPIGVPWAGPAEYLNENNSYPLKYELVPVVGMNDPEVYSINNCWAQPLTSSLIGCMREAFSFNKFDKQVAAKATINKFSLERNNLFDILQDIINDKSNNDQSLEEASVLPSSS